MHEVDITKPITPGVKDEAIRKMQSDEDAEIMRQIEALKAHMPALPKRHGAWRPKKARNQKGKR